MSTSHVDSGDLNIPEPVDLSEDEDDESEDENPVQNFHSRENGDSNTVKMMPGKNLEKKKYVSVDEGDKQMERKSDINSLRPDAFGLEGLPEASRTLTTDVKLSDFADIKHLCNGSHSQIFKALFAVEKVVVKVIMETSLASRVAQEEFRREVVLLSRMDHPNIVNLVGYGQLPSRTDATLTRPVIILEALNGDTLAYHLSNQRCSSKTPFTELRWLRIASEFAAALEYIHYKVSSKCTIIHRDLKPDNVGFTAGGVLKLLDFGLSTCLKRHTSSDDLYELTGCTGSLRYMAPEVALKKPYNEKVDIYGYGVIMYQVIVGLTPFFGYNQENFYAKVVNGNERPGLDYDDSGHEVRAHEDVKKLIMRCWDPESSRRPTSAEALEVITRVQMHLSEKKSKQGFLSRSVDRVFSKRDPI